MRSSTILVQKMMEYTQKMIENFHKTTSPFSHIFKLHSYRSILSRYFATYSAIAGYLLTSFSHNFVAIKTRLMSLQNIV